MSARGVANDASPEGPEALHTGQVHVWHARLDRAGPGVEAAERWLSRQERDRAARFHLERGRRRFVLAHAFLRGVLAGYLDCEPAEVALGRGPGGKPGLVSEPGGLRFNLSHSGELAVAAIGRGREIGVDVELVEGSDRAERVAGRVLSAAELAELRAIAAPAGRERAFLRAWTRKEALLKACGSGIDRDLAQLEVGTGEKPDPRVVTLAGHAGSWSIASFDPAPRYLGAVAAHGESLEVLHRSRETGWALPD